ncbi:MAG: hypothetical protein WC683_05910 [bacterium]
MIATLKADTQVVRQLLQAAVDSIDVGDTESAVWRTVDAAGLLAKHYPDAVGVAERTGRGYQITAF